MPTLLTSPGVSVAVEDDSVYAESLPTSVPLFILATRTDKTLPSGSGTAAGTTAANAGALTLVTSQRDALQSLGNPVFVTSSGAVVQGHETNEYGLHSLWSFLGTASRAYYLRANIDLGELVSTATEPTGDPADGTYWIDSDAVVGGIYRRNAANTAWEAVTFSVYLSAPGGGDGSAGDWAFDYSDANGTIKFKTDGGSWTALGGADLTATAINSRTATTDTLWIADAAPLGAGANDFWWKTNSASGGVDLKLYKFTASTSTWDAVTITRSATEPTSKASSIIWEDLSSVQSDGQRPLKIGNGSAFVALTHTTTAAAPTTDPADGTLWFHESATDFAMYKEDTNAWVELETVTVNNPTAANKVISASAPTSPSTGAYWIDISGANYDSYPVIKRYNGTAWEDITESVIIDATWQDPTAVADGSVWLNLSDPSTKNTVKEWDSTYEPVVVNSGGTAAETWTSSYGRWKPHAGATFGRKSVRTAIVTAMQAVISANNDIRSDGVRFQLIATPGYPELYDEMITLNTDIDETAFIIADVPARTIASGTPTGIEQTISNWKNNVSVAVTTGEDGFTSSTSPYAAFYYPWALSTNVDGVNVMVPSSTVALRTISYSDSVAYPWFAPFGDRRGLVSNASSVGYLNNDGEYTAVNLTEGQRDTLYDLNINPIAFFTNTGLRVWGQKTVYGSATSLDRINVARLVVKMKYDLKISLRAFLGEPNDANTWQSVRRLMERYMGGLQSLRAVYDFAIRCDENTNTAERIDRNELWAEVAIKPTKAVEFIYVPIRLVSTDGDLS